jgi:Ni/Co efflux regulator RcnB
VARGKQRVRELERQLKARDEEASRLSATLATAEQAAASAALSVDADAGAATSLLSSQLESARAALATSQADARDARAAQRRWACGFTLSQSNRRRSINAGIQQFHGSCMAAPPHGICLGAAWELRRAVHTAHACQDLTSN